MVAVLGACGPNDGAILTFEAPDGVDGAARIEIVLASANAEAIGTGIRQRMQPGALGEEDVVYYRQRAKGGIVDVVETLDGFQVRIEPEIDAAPDETFIPFALIYDDARELIAVGAVEDPDGNPMPVEIREDVRIEYTMTITPVTYPGATAPLETNQGLVVGCLDDQAEVWSSGVAWRPDTGPQLRLLFADLAADPSATDASERVADLDCDAFDAADNDCDDLRDAFHPGQSETCDGLDTDCDGRRMEVQSCVLPNSCGGMGVSLCTDMGANAISTMCQPDPTCACLDAGGNTCTRCVLGTRLVAGGAPRASCAPAIGKLHIEQYCEGSCTVEVVDVEGAEATISAVELGPFTANITSTGVVYLRVKTAPMFPAPSMTFTSVGRVFLAVTHENRTMSLNIDLEITDDSGGDCEPALLADNYSMFCTP
ncbi:MAG: putative metal-binding motif-containing protein [Kofleriaceae bacterium]